jgi:hypothetical protein
MSDNQSYQFCSRKGVREMGQSIAEEAQRMVRSAAMPIDAGETIKGQLRRAARSLGYRDGDWRVRAAWYGEAASWSAQAFVDLTERFEKWRERQEAKSKNESTKLADVYSETAERMRTINPELYRDEIVRFVALARRLRDVGHA